MRLAGFPSKYWHLGTFEGWEKISAEALLERCHVRPTACLRCFVACGDLSEVKEGRHKGLKIEGPEYETIYAFGGLCMVHEIEEIAYLNDICDRLGMDTISAGSLCAFAMEASEMGRIKEKITWGDVDKNCRTPSRYRIKKRDGRHSGRRNSPCCERPGRWKTWPFT